jgi:hypothetical protein
MKDRHGASPAYVLPATMPDFRAAVVVRHARNSSAVSEHPEI